MAKRIAPIALIFIFASIAWMVLGGSTQYRTLTQDAKLRDKVGQLWGTIHRQEAPKVFYRKTVVRDLKTTEGSETVIRRIKEISDQNVTLERSDIVVKLKLKHRKKGLLWYSTYRVLFAGEYSLKNNTDEAREFHFVYYFPVKAGLYDDFIIRMNGEKINEISPESGKVTIKMNLKPTESRTIDISYGSQGMDEWWYIFGSGISQLRDLKLTMETDFDDIDFPENSIAPTLKEKNGEGWKLTWQYSNLISGIQIGMDMPDKLNPGPFTSKISYFGPVSLFLFFFLLFIITTVKNINIHPMNYFFIAAAFFSFHLLMAYLVDHVNIYFAFAICSTVSIFLVISYMRLVIGTRFAVVEIGISQFVYLVLFSYAFFLKGFTGLAITLCCIVTLFVVMQFTGRVDWAKQFGNKSVE